jgi:murein DD-endopeptidase MepM/ murein hydrolase activator NlpD
MKNIILFFLCGLVLKTQTGENPNNSPLNILAKIKIQDLEKPPTTFDTSWVDSLQLSLPCKNAPVPERTMRLPNAPRDYRSGTHRGIDFFANWGTPVHTVAPGIVVRADHHFKEVPADFRENLLHTSARVGHTPSDIFSSVLLGQAIFIDHGFDLVPGFRVITIYAHLSGIEGNIIPGERVVSGALIGHTGNTGMRESTLGSKEGSHLHWEMILMKNEREIYLGQGMPNPALYEMLTRIFD